MHLRSGVLALILLVVGAPATAVERVLFVGNSLTAANDLPLLVEAMAKARGVALTCEAVTYPDLSLEDHWRRGTQKKIARGGYAFVVLQQGPSSLPESRANLRQWTQRFATEIRAAGATPALYTVWPDRSRRAYLPQVLESYRLANQDVRGVLLPAGETWQTAWKADPGLGLYAADGFHPSPLGTYAAAATIFGALTGHSPIGLPARLRLRNDRAFRVDEREAAVILVAAAEVVRPKE